jgi:hypothetical protein
MLSNHVGSRIPPVAKETRLSQSSSWSPLESLKVRTSECSYRIDFNDFYVYAIPFPYTLPLSLWTLVSSLFVSCWLKGLGLGDISSRIAYIYYTVIVVVV